MDLLDEKEYLDFASLIIEELNPKLVKSVILKGPNSITLTDCLTLTRNPWKISVILYRISLGYSIRIDTIGTGIHYLSGIIDFRDNPNLDEIEAKRYCIRNMISDIERFLDAYGLRDFFFSNSLVAIVESYDKESNH